jgi:DNA-binding CsgD family transcriptional regulator
LNNADIGRAHHISEDTVKTHMRRLLRKLGVCDRAAVAYVVGCSNAAVQVLPAPPTHNYDQLERQLKASWTDADMIVLLYHLAGLPNERIAQVLHCTASTTARYAARLRADVPATTTLAMVGRALLTINPTRFRPHVLACLPQAYAGMRYDTLEPGDQQLAVWLSYGVNVNNVAGIMHMNPYLCQARVAFMVQYLALWTPEQLALAAVLADQ